MTLHSASMSPSNTRHTTNTAGTSPPAANSGWPHIQIACPIHNDRRRPQAQKRPVGNHIIAPQYELGDADEQPRKRREKKRDEARLPAEKRADHHHQRDIAEAHRLAPQRRRADEPHRPHEPAAARPAQ